MKSASTLFVFLIAVLSFCQAQKKEPAPNIANSCCIYNKLEEYKSFLENISKKNSETLDKKVKKEYNEIINDKNTDLITELSGNNFLFDTIISPYLSGIFYHIVEKNGLDKNAFHFFLSRSPEVNAYTYEDGTIICNLGLLNIAETESQIAMVFCHELAHFLLNHANASIISSIEKFNSPEFIAQVKEIKKEKYNTKKKLEELLVTDLYNRRRHKRSYELAADSLGMVLLGKTDYGVSSVPHVFDLLDNSDSLLTRITVQAFCQREKIKVDEQIFVTKKKMSFGGGVKKEIVDTLKTHPDCALRKVYATEYFQKHPKQGGDFILSSKERLNKIKQLSFYAQAAYSKEKEALSYYFYQLIQNDISFPSDSNIKTEIFDLLVSFCIKQKKHSLAYVIQTPYATENEKDEYAKLLKLLHEADVQQFKEMAIAYYENNKNLIVLNNELSTNFNQIKQF